MAKAKAKAKKKKARGVLRVGKRTLIDGEVVVRGSRVLLVQAAKKKQRPSVVFKTRPVRVFVDVRRDGRGWGCFGPGMVSSSLWDSAREDVVDLASLALHEAWKTCGVRSELVIHNARGEIVDRRTYGEDPPGREG